MPPTVQLVAKLNSEQESGLSVSSCLIEDLRRQADALSLQACHLSTRLEDLCERREDREDVLAITGRASATSEAIYENGKPFGTALAGQATRQGSNRSIAGEHSFLPGNVDPRLNQPSYITSLPPLSEPAQIELEALSEAAGSFDWIFLTTTLGGAQWSPGFYYTSSPSTVLAAHSGYYILDADFDPYIPTYPGAHGAKLTAFFNPGPTDPGSEQISSTSASTKNDTCPSESSFNNAPLFLGRPANGAKKAYVYLGHYSQPRLSDRLDHQRQLEAVPMAVKSYWAEQLTDPHRPAWATKSVMEHFFPRPVYRGPLLARARTRGEGNSSLMGRNEVHVASREALKKCWNKYLRELEGWEKEARTKVSLLTPDDVMAAFDEPDSAAIPGLRLWWEYLVCVGFEPDFVHGLVAIRDKKEPAASSPVIKARSQTMLVRSAAASTKTGKGTSEAGTSAIKAWLESTAASAGPGWAVTDGHAPHDREADDKDHHSAQVDGGPVQLVEQQHHPPERDRKYRTKDQDMYVPPHLRRSKDVVDAANDAGSTTLLQLTADEKDVEAGDAYDAYVPLHIRIAAGATQA